MATTKITKRDRFNTLLTYSEVKADPDMVAFIEHEISLLDKKNSKSGEKKVNEKMENAKSTVLDYLASVEKACVRDIMAVLDTDSSQFATAVLTALYAKGEGAIERFKEKGKSMYRIK